MMNNHKQTKMWLTKFLSVQLVESKNFNFINRPIIPEQCTFCPNCNLPANVNAFRELITHGKDNTCPMCANDVNIG